MVCKDIINPSSNGTNFRYFYAQCVDQDQTTQNLLSIFQWNISAVLRETTLTISDSIETGAPAKSEIVGVVFLCTTEITELTEIT